MQGRKGAIAPGLDADLAIVDMRRPYTLRENDLYYRHAHTPYAGMSVSCWVTATVSAGRPIYDAD